MTDETNTSRPDTAPTATPEDKRPLTPQAQRALEEAETRRRQREASDNAVRPAEVGGRKGPDPVRYGDWEKGGIISDF